MRALVRRQAPSSEGISDSPYMMPAVRGGIQKAIESSDRFRKCYSDKGEEGDTSGNSMDVLYGLSQRRNSSLGEGMHLKS